LSNNFPIQNGLKQGDVLPSLYINCSLGYVIRKIGVNQAELKLIGTHKLLVSADDVNLLDDSMATKKNTEL
jgi:hypothetical protein